MHFGKIYFYAVMGREKVRSAAVYVYGDYPSIS